MTAPLRLTFLINDLSRAGAETQLVELAVGLDHAAYDVEVLLLKERNDFAQRLAAAGVPVTALRRRGACDVLVLARLWHHLRRRKPHVLHAWLFLSNLLGAIVGRIAGVPSIIVSQRCSYESTLGTGWRRLARLSHRLADVVTVNSRAALQEEVAAGFPAERIRYVPNGVASRDAPAPPRRDLGLPEGALALSMGQLEEVKGHRILLEAWPAVQAALPGARLCIVGGGSLRSPLERRARDLGIEASVVFTGFQATTAPYVSACDIFVQPSLSEGMPNAVLEAMAAGKPVIATAVGGNPEMVLEAVTGLLVPPGDPEALGAALVRLLEAGDLRHQMGSAGARRARAQFSLGAAVGATVNVYRSLPSGRTSNVTS